MSDVFKTLKRVLVINNRNLDVQVAVKVDEDFDIRIEDDYDNGTPEEIQAYCARFKSGNDLFIANVSVEATALGETGYDSLGACHIHVNNMFNSDPFNADVENILKDHGMIERALNDLQQAIVAKAWVFKQFVN